MRGILTFGILTLIGGGILWLATIALMAPINISGPFNFSKYPYFLVMTIFGMTSIIFGGIAGGLTRVKTWFLSFLAIGLAVQNYILYRRFPPREGRVMPEYEDLVSPDPIQIVTSMIILILVAILATMQIIRTRDS